MADIRSETPQDPADLQPACETGRMMHPVKTMKSHIQMSVMCENTQIITGWNAATI